MELLLKQNAMLEAEVARLCRAVDEATQGVLRRGYLHKYRERCLLHMHHTIHSSLQ